MITDSGCCVYISEVLHWTIQQWSEMSQSFNHSYTLDNTVLLYSQCSAVLRNDHEPYTQ